MQYRAASSSLSLTERNSQSNRQVGARQILLLTDAIMTTTTTNGKELVRMLSDLVTSGPEFEYQLEDGGLVVIIKQINHNLFFRGDWSGNEALNYKADEERLEKLFSSKKKNKIKIMKKENLTRAQSGDHSFDLFMSEVCEWGKKQSVAPKFVMFFLLSHGFGNGEFLLATEDGKGDPVRCCQVKPSNGKDHALEGECHGRHIVQDVIKPINERYPRIPKVFVIQTCRGSEGNVVEKSTSDPEVGSDRNPSDFEFFIPEMSDTLVLRACVEKNCSWVLPEEQRIADLPNGGSLLIQMFCKSWEDLLNNKKELEKLRKKKSQKQFADCLKRCEENVLGGWLMNVCQRTTSLVTNCLWVQFSLPSSKLGKLLKLSEHCLNSKTEENIHEEFVASLEEHKASLSPQPASVDTLLGVLNGVAKERKKHKLSCDMFAYLYGNVGRNVPSGELESSNLGKKDKAEVVKVLNDIIEEVRRRGEQAAYDKQQPHITSNLSKKFSCLKLLVD